MDVPQAKEFGVMNESADRVPRNDMVWSDTNLDDDFDAQMARDPKLVFWRLQCRNCGGIHFEVMSTDSYETSAKCVTCGMYYIVHSG